MKFKIGDKVKHKNFGIGEVIGFDAHDNQYAIEFENEHHDSTHNFSNTYKRAGLDKPIDRNAGYWCWDNEIELIEEASKSLIPQIAKMLGVEIGEEFGVSSHAGRFYFDDKWLFKNGERPNSDTIRRLNAILSLLLSGSSKIEKLPKKPQLTEAERVILENLPKEYKWIARDKYGELTVFESKPFKEEGVIFWRWHDGYTLSLKAFKHLFQFIKWEDEESYNIEELLKESNNDK